MYLLQYTHTLTHTHTHTHTHTLPHTHTGHSAEVTCVEFVRGGGGATAGLLLVSGSADGWVRVWNGNTGQCVSVTDLGVGILSVASNGTYTKIAAG